MNNEILLTPEELYYLGAAVQAKYIDYAYVAAMDDIGQNYALFESDAKNSLVDAGILMEDFSGSVELDSNAEMLIRPIFFGEKETSVDICEVGEERSVTVIKYHFLDDNITMVSGKDGKLRIKHIDTDEIYSFIKRLLPDSYPQITPAVKNDISKETVSRFFAVKSVVIEKQSVVKTYIESDNIIYREKEDGSLESVPKEVFVDEVYNIVKGE